MPAACLSGGACRCPLSSPSMKDLHAPSKVLALTQSCGRLNSAWAEAFGCFFHTEKEAIEHQASDRCRATIRRSMASMEYLPLLWKCATSNFVKAPMRLLAVGCCTFIPDCGYVSTRIRPMAGPNWSSWRLIEIPQPTQILSLQGC